MPKSSYRIAFMVDVKWRDLPGLALLKYFLETRYGHDVLLVRKLGHHLVRKSFRPHMAFLTHALGPNQRHLAHVLKQDGTLIGVLPTEGRGTSPSHLEVVAGKYSDSRDVDLYLAWSETVRD